MNCLRIFLLFILVAIFNVSNASASRVKKGYVALEVKDYFSAKKHFTKGLKYNNSPSAYGLAIIYSRDDNPFFDLDSAYRYILFADSTYNDSADRKKQKWQIYGWSSKSIDSLKLIVSTSFFKIARENNSVLSYSKFIQRHPWSREYERAIYSRDSLAFFQAVANNDANSYRKFVEAYPESEFGELALENYHNSQFLELTGDGTLESFTNFVASHPESPQRKEADAVIFKMVTESNTEDAFKDFVLNYSQNTFIEEGWKQFYQVYLFDYSKGRMVEFKKTYPQALNMDEVDFDIALYNSVFLPFMKNGKYGFMNEDGQIIIDAKFQFVEGFNEGLSSFAENDKVGFIDKKGNIRIAPKYDGVSAIVQGLFIVENDDLFGLIDRKGKVIMPCKYNDIGELSEGFIYASIDEEYFYANYNGLQLFTESLISASDFENNHAIVETETGVGVIDRMGAFLLPPLYNQLNWISDSLLSFSENEQFGIVSITGDTILNVSYNYIGDFSDNIALVSISDTVKYIDERGEVILSNFYETYPNYKLKGDFTYGAAIIAKDGKYGRINTSGDVVTEIEYENIGSGTKFIPYEKEEYWGLMSLSNKILVSPKYDALDIVNDNRAITKLEDSIGLIDVNGNVLLDNSYKSIDYLTENSYAVSNGENYALFVDSNFVSNFEYKTISYLSKRFVSLKGDMIIDYYDLERKKVVKLKERSE